MGSNAGSVYKVLDALSCNLSVILKLSDTKLDKNITVDQNLEGSTRLLRPPPGSATINICLNRPKALQGVKNALYYNVE